MVDFSQLLGGDPGGLLTPEQAGGVNQNFLQALGAGLMKASGPSLYKPGMTAFSGIGEALQGGLAARREAQKDAMAQTVARAKMLEGLAPMLQQRAAYQSLGIPMPPEQEHLLNTLMRGVMGSSYGTGPKAPGGAVPGMAPGTTPGAAPGTTGAAGASGEETGASGLPPGTPDVIKGYRTNLLVQLTKEHNLPPLAPIPGMPGHESLMEAAKTRILDTDPVHQRIITETKMQDKELDDLGKRVRELRDLGKLTPENLKPIIDRMQEIGVDEKIIKRLVTGAAAAPEAKPVSTISVGRGAVMPGAAPPPVMPGAGTLPPGMASMLGGIGTPPAPRPAEATGAAGGLPAAPAPVTPPPGATPPPSPLRVPGAGGSFLPPPAGALPPLPPTPKPTAAAATISPVERPTATAPALAPPPTRPEAAPGVPPSGVTVASQLGIKPNETEEEQRARLGVKDEYLTSGHPKNAWAKEVIKADSEANNAVKQTRQEIEAKYKSDLQEAVDQRKLAETKRLETQHDVQMALLAKDIKTDEKQFPIFAALHSNGVRTMEDNALSRDLVRDKNFHSGIFGPITETINKWKAAFGQDPNAAFSQEVFGKVTAKNTIDALEAFKADSAKMDSSAGRVLLQMYTTIQKAVQGLTIGKGSNIFLANLNDNLAKANIDLGRMAIEYKKTSPNHLLDDGFTEKVQDYLEKNPVYKHGMIEEAKQEALKIERENKGTTSKPVGEPKEGTMRKALGPDGKTMMYQTYKKDTGWVDTNVQGVPIPKLEGVP